MRRHITYIAALALTLTVPAISAVAAQHDSTETSATAKGTPHFKGEHLAKNAKISLKTARAIALKSTPGKITDEELEVEKGGSGLRYSFDIKQGSVTREVGVDAKTGKVLEDSKEGTNPD